MDFVSRLVCDVSDLAVKNQEEAKIFSIIALLCRSEGKGDALNLLKFETLVEKTIIAYELDRIAYVDPAVHFWALKKDNAHSIKRISMFLDDDIIYYVVSRANGGNAAARLKAILLIAEEMTVMMTPAEVLPSAH